MANFMSRVSSTMKKGTLRATAKRAGLLSGPKDKLTLADVAKLKKSNDPKTRKRATLAETFMHSKHG